MINAPSPIVAAPARARPYSRSQAGVALVIALLLLMMVSLLSIAMFRSFGLAERIAGNTREKQHALQAAQSALQNAEYWVLASGNQSTGTVCGGAPATLTVCSDASAAVATPAAVAALNPAVAGSWAVGAPYTKTSSGLPLSTFMPLSATPTAGTYYAAPQAYIQYVGTITNGINSQGLVYQITAAGVGGNPNAVAVVQSSYAINGNVKDLGQ